MQVEKVDFETIFLGKEDLDHFYNMAYILTFLQAVYSFQIELISSHLKLILLTGTSAQHVGLELKTFLEIVLLCFNFSHSKPPTPSFGIIFSVKALKEFAPFFEVIH